MIAKALRRIVHAWREYLSCVDCVESGERQRGQYGCRCTVKAGVPGWWTER